jgi:hypothetical protein
VPANNQIVSLQSLLISALGTKRLASEELANEWDNKRLNPGNASYPLSVCVYDPFYLLS